jgi:hypothetical protein
VIALILGGAPSVWRELAEAQALLNRRHLVVAANLAGIHHTGRLDAWATLHPDLLAGWVAQRQGNADFRAFSPCAANVRRNRTVELAAERWPGSSGLYAAQVALFEMGATAAILCGVPMQSEAGHFTGRATWEGVGDYRQAFASAIPEIGGRVRSMAGWTAQLFGKPTAVWIGAVDNIQTLGPSRPDPRSSDMHKVTNTSKGTKSFWARNHDGGDMRVHLQPGEVSEPVDINPDDPVFADVNVKAHNAGAAAARPRRAAKPAAKRTRTAKPAPPAAADTNRA